MVGTKDSAQECYSRDEFHDDSHKEEEEDDDEALSLCDLPMYGDSFKWEDDFSSGKTNRSLSSFDENDNNDYFEFSSGDFSSADFSSGNHTAMYNKDIIFCGKLIRYKESSQVENQNLKICNEKQKPREHSVKKSLFQYWNSSNDKTGKVSSLASAPIPVKKSRWYLYMFGMTLLPRAEMGLRDIKLRQSRRRRRSPTTMFPVYDKNGGETIEAKVSSKKSKGRKSGRLSLWGLLKIFSCRSHHAEAIAKATLGCTDISSP